MFATSDWEPDVPKGNISFGKKPFKAKSEKTDITSTLQNVDNNHDVYRGFPTTQSTIKPKKSKNKSNHKKSLVKSQQGQDLDKTLPVKKNFKIGIKNGSANLKTENIKVNKVLPSPESLKNNKKEKQEKRAKEQNIKTENLKALLNQFNDCEGVKDSPAKLLLVSDESKPKNTKVTKHLKNKTVASEAPADVSNDAMNTFSNVTSESKNKKKKPKNLEEKNNMVVSAVTGNDESVSSTLKPTAGCFVRNPNYNNELDETSKTVNRTNELTKKQKKRQRKNKNNTNDEQDSNAVNKAEETSRKRKQDTTNEDDEVESKKLKQSKDVPKLKQTGSTECTEEYNDLSAPKAKTSGKKERLKEKLKNMLSVGERSSIVTKGNKLRDRMMEKLKSAQFRYLNEKLYTSSGTEAQQLFQSDPTAFQTYHEGYQQQVKKWPVNPIDVIAKLILKMPKTTKIADMGCGEAVLSKRVPHAVRSFDLVATSPNVEACDMAHTPLLSASMDVVVYCLALMGTDLTQYLVEANRVLKMGGLLYIAEVESRFDKPEDFTELVQRLGFKLLKLDKSHEVFFFMQFRKFQDPPAKKSKLPALSLKPCLYKRR